MLRAASFHHPARAKFPSSWHAQPSQRTAGLSQNYRTDAPCNAALFASLLATVLSGLTPPVHVNDIPEADYKYFLD